MSETLEDLRNDINNLYVTISGLEARNTRNEIVAIALSRLLFSQGILPLTPDLKYLLINTEAEE
jgi:hypothetical protein